MGETNLENVLVRVRRAHAKARATLDDGSGGKTDHNHLSARMRCDVSLAAQNRDGRIHRKISRQTFARKPWHLGGIVKHHGANGRQGITDDLAALRVRK